MSIFSVEDNINSSNDSEQMMFERQLIDFRKDNEREEAGEKNVHGKQKISKFIQTHQISIEQFWKSNRNHASLDDIKNFCDDIGLKLAVEDELQLKKSIFKDNAVLSIYEFCDLVECWKIDKEKKIINFIRNRTEKMADAMKNKFSNSNTKKLTRPASSCTFKSMNQTGNYTNKSKEYLVQQKLKQKTIENNLEVAIKKAKNEYEYELLIKMGEANDLNKQLQSVVTYRAYKNAQGNLKVRIFNLDKFEKEINLEEFQREFNNIKKKYNETKKISVWQVLSGAKNSADNMQNLLNTKKNIKKCDRHKELTTILTQTMNLTKTLKDQLAILKTQGIYIKN